MEWLTKGFKGKLSWSFRELFRHSGHRCMSAFLRVFFPLSLEVLRWADVSSKESYQIHKTAVFSFLLPVEP
jgi:hypothetical protein